MEAHVFIVDRNTFKFHLEYLFAGTGAKDKSVPFLVTANIKISPATERMLTGMIADISRIRIGDKIIFYLQASSSNQGMFFGIFKATSKAFFDDNDNNNYLKNDGLSKGLSFRILIEPSEVYAKGITEHEYLDSLDGKSSPCQLCWSLIYRKLKGNRGCTMITDYEFTDLKNKLISKNQGKTLSGEYFSYDSSKNEIVSCKSSHTYCGKQENISIINRLLYKAKRNNSFEAHLQTYILQNFDNTPLKELLLPNPNLDIWIGNEISCGVGLQRIDIMIKQEDFNNIYIKLIELKDEKPTINIIDYQLSWYLEWLSYYVVPNYYVTGKKIIIKPCILAAKTNNTAILDKIKNNSLQALKTSAVIEPTEYISFSIDDTNNIIFEKII